MVSFKKYLNQDFMKDFLFIFRFIVFIFLGSNISYGQDLKLMTYNIRLNTESDSINKWDNRKEFLSSQIAFYEPDIFGLQEAKPEQVEYLEKRFPSYERIGVGRDENGTGGSFLYIL